MAAGCSFCGATSGPFTKVEGLFTVLMCADCQAARGHGSGPYCQPPLSETLNSFAHLKSSPTTDRDTANYRFRLTAITDEAPPFALPSTRNRLRTAVHRLLVPTRATHC
jgi:hypothetical protein